MLCCKVKGNISILPPPLSLLCLVSLIVCLPRSGNVRHVKKKRSSEYWFKLRILIFRNEYSNIQIIRASPNARTCVAQACVFWGHACLFSVCIFNTLFSASMSKAKPAPTFSEVGINCRHILITFPQVQPTQANSPYQLKKHNLHPLTHTQFKFHYFLLSE